MQLRHYARVIWRSLRLLLLVMCLVSGATYAISKFLIAPVYQANALVQVDAAGGASAVFANQAQAVTLSLLVTNGSVLQAAAQDLQTVTAGQLGAAISASPLDGTSIIQIRARASNSQQAANMANVVAQHFITIQEANASAALQNSLQQLTPALDTAKNNLITAQTQLNNLQQARASAAAIQKQTSVLEDAQSTYDTLLLNSQQIQQQLDQVKGLLTLVQKAFPPAAPISPNASLNTEIAAALSALLVLVFVFVRDWLDASIRTPEDVAHLTALEPLGSVPLSKKALLSLAPQGASTGDDRTVEQACMIMALSLVARQTQPAAVLVTALHPGAGASTTAANLAISLARAGKRTLLIDANLQRPALQSIFQCPTSKGLVDSLAEIRGLPEEEIFAWFDQWTTPLPNLWLLPAGPATPRSAPVLSSPELRALVHWLLHAGGGVVDYIIFDASSLKEGADPVTLTAFTDHTVLVADAGKERGELLNKAGAIFQQVGSPVFGVIINRQTPKHRPYFYVEHAQQSAVFAEPSPMKAASVLAAPTASSGIGAPLLHAPEKRKSKPSPHSLASSASLPSRPDPY
jgi:capsular exopolysaccharide synthesis family protein